MYFLIQSNIKGDTDHEKIIPVLEELNIGYETIELTNLTEKIEVKADRKDVFVFGSVKLARLAKANTNWYPGSSAPVGLPKESTTTFCRCRCSAKSSTPLLCLACGYREWTRDQQHNL